MTHSPFRCSLPTVISSVTASWLETGVLPITPQGCLTAVIDGKSHFIDRHPFRENELTNTIIHLINPSLLEFTPLLNLGSLMNLINADFSLPSR